MTDTPTNDSAAPAPQSGFPSDILARPAPGTIPPKAEAAPDAPAPDAATVLYDQKKDDGNGDPPKPDGAVDGDPPASEEPAKPGEGDAKDTPADKDNPVPLTVESYSTLAVPDTITVSEPILHEAKELFAAEGVSPAAAQKLLAFYAKASSDAAAAQAAAWQATQSEWTTSINSLPEFQGEQRARSEAVLGQAIEEFGDPSVREFFRMTGDHPGVVKMILSMGNALMEEGPLPPGRPTGGTKRAPQSFGEALYGPSPKTN